MVPGPREPGSQEDSQCCSFLWRWPGGRSLCFPRGRCRSCGVRGVALRVQVSMALWGHPGAMAGASLLRAGVEASRSHSALSPWPRPALPSPLVCQPRVVCRRGPAPPGRTVEGRGLCLSAQGPTGDWGQEPENSVALRIPKASAPEVS